MRRISPAHNTTKAIPSSMLSMFRLDFCLSTWSWEINWLCLWDILSSVTFSSREIASEGKLDLSTHCRYSFLFFLLRRYFNDVASHRKHCPVLTIPTLTQTNIQVNTVCSFSILLKVIHNVDNPFPPLYNNGKDKLRKESEVNRKAI